MTKNSRQVQVFPGGQLFTVRGEDAELEIQDGENWRKPTPEEAKGVRVQELAEMYLRRDVWCCDSCLVDDMLKNSCELPGDMAQEWSFENVSNLSIDSSDWDLERCKAWLDDESADYPDPNPDNMGRDELLELLDGVEEAEDLEPMTDEQLTARAWEAIADEEIDGLDEYREAVRNYRDENQPEIYEWWQVDKWLAGKLEEIGECVLTNSYGVWWGRCCTGQGILMDGTLQKVAEEFA